jgi:xylulokinase
LRCRVCVDSEGARRGSAQREYSRDTPNPGWVELDTNKWWEIVAATIRQAISESDAPTEQLRGLGIAAETDGIVPIDAEGKPLRSYIHWSDARCYPQYDWMLDHADIEEIYRTTGIPLHKSWWSPPALKMLWIKENEPDIFEKTKKFLQIGNYILYKLTGKYVNDYSTAARTMFFDIHNLTWSEPLAGFLGVPLSTQPALCKSAEIAGTVTESAAALTGIPVGTQVVAGGGDTECSGLAAGLTAEGQVLVSIGTSLMMLVADEKPPFLSDKSSRRLSGTGMFSSCHVVNGLWLLEAGSMAGARLTWFKNEFGHLEDHAASNLGLSPYDLLSVEAKNSKPNFKSPVFVLSNDAILNLTLEHKRADVIRSILEGVAYETRQIIEAARMSGIGVRNIIMVGGGSKSDVWRQIISDVNNMPVRSPDLSETAALGAAILAGLGTKVYNGINRVPRTCVFAENVPNQEMHETYELLYERFRRFRELSRQ